MRNHIFNSLLTVATITYSGNLAAQQKPNVIFIYADDLGKGLLSAYGQKQYTTFLYHPTQLPHGPVSVPEVYPEIQNNFQLTPIEKEYASMVKKLDIHVGLILQELRKQGLEKNTIVVFSSDNGHEIYYSQKGRAEKPYRNLQSGEFFDGLNNKYFSSLSGDIFNGNASMAGLKRSNLQDGVNVPLIFYWKGTFAENVLLPDNRYVVYSSNPGAAIVENTGWKLRHYAKKNIFELYNLNTDPQERNNLIDNYPQIAEKLINILIRECESDLRNGINKTG
ncbi:MAG: sulfatase-like hydrolase/transferase [Petrimonas sp.]|nr:sulfatase-like hydrolase/transferase [Petrimonas sp.]